MKLNRYTVQIIKATTFLLAFTSNNSFAKIDTTILIYGNWSSVRTQDTLQLNLAGKDWFDIRTANIKIINEGRIVFKKELNNDCSWYLEYHENEKLNPEMINKLNNRVKNRFKEHIKETSEKIFATDKKEAKKRIKNKKVIRYQILKIGFCSIPGTVNYLWNNEIQLFEKIYEP